MLSFTNIRRNRTVRLMVQNNELRIWNTPQRVIYKHLKCVLLNTDLYHKCWKRMFSHMAGAWHDDISCRTFIFSPRSKIFFVTTFSFFFWYIRLAGDDWKEAWNRGRQRAKRVRECMFSNLDFGLTQFQKGSVSTSWGALQPIDLRTWKAFTIVCEGCHRMWKLRGNSHRF